MSIHDALDDGKAEAHALDATGEEGLEDASFLALRDPGAAVLNLDPGLVGVGESGDAAPGVAGEES